MYVRIKCDEYLQFLSLAKMAKNMSICHFICHGINFELKEKNQNS
jgi:hypothetical protein